MFRDLRAGPVEQSYLRAYPPETPCCDRGPYAGFLTGESNVLPACGGYGEVARRDGAADGQGEDGRALGLGTDSQVAVPGRTDVLAVGEQDHSGQASAAGARPAQCRFPGLYYVGIPFTRPEFGQVVESRRRGVVYEGVDFDRRLVGGGGKGHPRQAAGFGPA